jgi:acyl-coenzyme A synthetase/AMP-(fatty) acid ligase
MRPEFTLHDLLHNAVERDPGGVAVVDGSTEYTYEDLERASNSLGAALIESGVEKGDRVGVYMEKSWEAIVAMLAASRVGAAYVNINPLFKPPQVAYVAQDCDVRVMIGDSPKLDDLEPGTVRGTAFYRGERPGEESAGHLTDLAEVFRNADAPRAERQVSEIDLLTILYTSGSTGMP